MQLISVLIPIYYKESTETIEKCFASISNQERRPDEVVCVLDDPSTPEIEKKLDELKENTGLHIVRCYCKRGSGLGAVLNEGVQKCTGYFIARMDADDIASPDRLAKEAAFLTAHPEVDVVGSNIAEFDTSPEQIVAYRKVPESDASCKEMLKFRNPINHMTAMFRRDSILKAGNYSPAMKSCEDIHLWTTFYKHGMVFANIQENLVFVHAGKTMYKRRGGMNSYRFVKEAIKYRQEVGLISKPNEIFQRFANFCVLVVMPNDFRAFVYEKFLRKKPEKEEYK